VPEAVTFRITSYWKLAKGETGLTQAASLRIGARTALDWILAEFPEDAVKIGYADGKTTIVIDWASVPEGVRNPKIPVRPR
jgi:hypothetical protein